MICLVYSLSFELLRYTMAFRFLKCMLFYCFSAKVKVAQLYLPVVPRCKFYFT